MKTKFKKKLKLRKILVANLENMENVQAGVQSLLMGCSQPDIICLTSPLTGCTGPDEDLRKYFRN